MPPPLLAYVNHVVWQRTLQPQALDPAPKPFDLLGWIDENDRHRFLMYGANDIVRVGRQKREERPVAFFARTAFLSRLFGEAFPSPRTPNSCEACNLMPRNDKPFRIDDGLRESGERYEATVFARDHPFAIPLRPPFAFQIADVGNRWLLPRYRRETQRAIVSSTEPSGAFRRIGASSSG